MFLQKGITLGKYLIQIEHRRVRHGSCQTVSKPVHALQPCPSIPGFNRKADIQESKTGSELILNTAALAFEKERQLRKL
jgi:hypothetical protein